VVQFVTLVQIRPGGTGKSGSRVAAHAAQWQHLKNQIQLVGGRVNQIWNVLGNDYDLLFVGEADDPKTLHRIDAVCKGQGYAAKTHPAIGQRNTPAWWRTPQTFWITGAGAAAWRWSERRSRIGTDGLQKSGWAQDDPRHAQLA